jgi:hypothetical protein
MLRRSRSSRDTCARPALDAGERVDLADLLRLMADAQNARPPSRGFVWSFGDRRTDACRGLGRCWPQASPRRLRAPSPVLLDVFGRRRGRRAARPRPSAAAHPQHDELASSSAPHADARRPRPAPVLRADRLRVERIEDAAPITTCRRAASTVAPAATACAPSSRSCVRGAAGSRSPRRARGFISGKSSHNIGAVAEELRHDAPSRARTRPAPRPKLRQKASPRRVPPRQAEADRIEARRPPDLLPLLFTPLKKLPGSRVSPYHSPPPEFPHRTLANFLLSHPYPRRAADMRPDTGDRRVSEAQRWDPTPLACCGWQMAPRRPPPQP